MSLSPKFIVERIDAMQRVDLARRALGLSRAAFCELIGAYAPNYSKLMRGEHFLTVDQIYTLYRTYNIDPAFIIAGKVSDLPQSLIDKMRVVEEAQS